MREALAMPDADARRLAITTFDRNIVVTASAGTGKTTLLVDRLVQLLLKPSSPVSLTEIVALTFMEKAANEMKIRIRSRLLELLGLPSSVVESAAGQLLSADEIRLRAERALQELERSQIGTIHSFAAHLIRLYPLEAGVDPRFEPDDGQQFEHHFTREWDEWLSVELGARGRSHVAWSEVLRRTSLDSLRALAKKLVNDLIPLDRIASQIESRALSPVMRQWLERSRQRTVALLAGHRNGEKERRQVEKLLAAAEVIFAQVLASGVAAVRELDDETKSFLQDKSPGSKPPGDWEETEFLEAVSLIDTAKALLDTNHDFLRTVLTLLTPFAAGCRQRFLESGRVGFDGLLARARDLLKHHPEVRKRLKQQFKAILVDEFQDTDPVQYEILLFLSERPEDCALRWPEIRLQPGKLFIVGDPKQSIFAFRRADIEAFQRVTEGVVEQGGLALTLTTNFRSHASILSAVNGMFSRLISKQEGLQPGYDHLEPQPARKTAAGVQGLELRLVVQNEESDDGEELNAERAVRSEADALASWLKTEIIGKDFLVEPGGRRRKVEPGDVAMLFRKFNEGREYLEALRRHGVPYVAEGEKHFYQRQEVVDFVNLLRCIQNPDDGVARLGLFRSPLGALTDEEIVHLVVLGAVDYRMGRHPNLAQHAKADHLRRLYAVLEALHDECPHRSLPDAVDLIFKQLPVLELAAASLHGEQAVANLWKIRALTAELVADPHLTLAGFVQVLAARIDDPPDESESGLAEESLEAVRVMTIHKAKGLEFPIVVLVGMQAGTQAQQEQILVHHDWSTDVVGLCLDGIGTVEGVFLAKKLQARVAAERRRLFYVAMTRAKERLVLSGVLTRRPAGGNLLALCQEAIGEGIGREDVGELTAGEGRIVQTILQAEEGQPRKKKRKEASLKPAVDVGTFVSAWQARAEHYAQHASSIAVTPTSLSARTFVRPSSSRSTTSAPLLGTIAHAVLQHWAYDDNLKELHELCEKAIDAYLPENYQGERDALRQDLREMVNGFAMSEACAELRAATILGREVPFIMPVKGPSSEIIALMEGRIDLLYEKDGRVWVADYKTDRVTETELPERAETYRAQARSYLQAVRESCGQDPAGFKLIFVRAGKAISV